MKTQVEINIDELVLHGFAPGEGKRIGEAVEAALMQAFNAQPAGGTIKQSADIPFINGGSFALQKNSNPNQVSNSISNSIYTSLGNINKSK